MADYMNLNDWRGPFHDPDDAPNDYYDSSDEDGYSSNEDERPASVLDLPSELLNKICSYLTADDHGSARRACGDLFLRTTHSYYTIAFGMIKTDLSLGSLQRLDRLSKNKDKAPYVRTLWITCPNSEDKYVEMLWTFYRDGRLVLPQPGTKWLQDIVRRLTNCVSFWFSHDKRDQSVWSHPTIADTVSIILPTLADVKRRVKEFKFSSNHQEGRNLHPFIELDPVPHAGSPEIWSELESLWLGIDKLRGQISPIQFGLRLLPHAPKLRRIILRFDRYSRMSETVELMDCLLTGTFPFRLETLVLEDIFGIEEASLGTFLRSHSQTLRDLRLTSIYLDRGHWSAIFKSLATRGTFPALTAIQLDSLSEGSLKSQDVKFHRLFKNPRVDRARGTQIECSEEETDEWMPRVTHCVLYSGPRMDLALKRIANGASLGKAFPREHIGTEPPPRVWDQYSDLSP
ncbi:hypothetical protein BJY00DRAFT_311436 [Aspergillus carlsbadensis]|nr:hypothetical protein BJY00DRAFT_311436 [Aspergillus carlsbadensis]